MSECISAQSHRPGGGGEERIMSLIMSSGMKTLVVWPPWQGYYYRDRLSGQWRVLIIMAIWWTLNKAKSRTEYEKHQAKHFPWVKTEDGQQGVIYRPRAPSNCHLKAHWALATKQNIIRMTLKGPVPLLRPRKSCYSVSLNAIWSTIPLSSPKGVITEEQECQHFSSSPTRMKQRN